MKIVVHVQMMSFVHGARQWVDVLLRSLTTCLIQMMNINVLTPQQKYVVIHTQTVRHALLMQVLLHNQSALGAKQHQVKANA